jgi:hypothetical protein
MSLADVRTFDTTIQDPKTKEKMTHPITLRRVNVIGWSPSPAVPSTTVALMTGGHKVRVNTAHSEFHQWAIGRSLEEIDQERAEGAHKRAEKVSKRK